MNHPIQDVIGTFVNGIIAEAEKVNIERRMAEQCIEPLEWLRDCRTITYNIPRQMGASSWIVGEYLKHEDSILIVHSQSVRESLRDSYLRDGTYAEITKCHDRIDVGLPAYQMARMVTADEVKQWVRNRDRDFFMREKGSLKRIYIQCEGMLFSKVNKNHFYDWVSRYVLDNKGWVIGSK